MSESTRSGLYDHADDLQQDLRGENGEARRWIADGYLTAIQDFDAAYLNGEVLLSELCCGEAHSRRLSACGYVMAVRDLMPSAAQPTSDQHARQMRSDMNVDADHVRSWLERNPRRRSERALGLVRSALEESNARAPSARSSRAAAILTPKLSNSLVARCLLAATVGLAAIVIYQQGSQRQPTASSLIASLAINERASKIANLVLEERRYEKDSFINMNDSDEFSTYEKRWNECRVELAKSIADASALGLTSSDQDDIRQIAADFGTYAYGYERVLTQIKDGRISTAAQANSALAAYKGAAHRIELHAAAIFQRSRQRLEKVV